MMGSCWRKCVCVCLFLSRTRVLAYNKRACGWFCSRASPVSNLQKSRSPPGVSLGQFMTLLQFCQWWLCIVHTSLVIQVVSCWITAEDPPDSQCCLKWEKMLWLRERRLNKIQYFPVCCNLSMRIMPTDVFFKIDAAPGNMTIICKDRWHQLYIKVKDSKEMCGVPNNIHDRLSVRPLICIIHILSNSIFLRLYTFSVSSLSCFASLIEETF